MVENENSYLVVGGTSGIGMALVGQLVKNGRVSVWSRNVVDDLLDGTTHYSWDATSDDAPPETPHPLSGLAYCPGSIRLKPIARMTDADFREDFEINCIGAIRTIRSCIPALRRATNASVVLFSTVAVT